MIFETGRRSRRLLLVGVVAAVALVVVSLAMGGAGGAGRASTVLATFDRAGFWTWKVPADVTSVNFDVFGASGGSVKDGNVLVARGGAGGEAKARFAVHPGDTFEIVVGGRGQDGSGPPPNLSTFGLNGGRPGSVSDQGGYGGSQGGGGSDVRIGGRGTNCAADRVCGFGDRIVVGGGGGGASGSGVNGGVGGGLTGGPTAAPPGPCGQSYPGGTQECGGWYSPCSCGGIFGVGGTNYDAAGPHFGEGGGGGGWYGGSSAFGGGTASGGGSGFISRFASRGSFPGGIRRGDGLVTISTP